MTVIGEAARTSPLPAPTRPAGAPEVGAAFAGAALATGAYLLAPGSELQPSALVGHGLGVIGVLLMVFAEVGYSWRKRTTRIGPGSVRRWLQLHVFAGLLGPYLVLLHGAFRFRGLAGILSLLVAVVVASGLVGRFVYGATPRTAGARPNPARRVLALWYLLHVPLALAMFALAGVHIVAALHYATLSR